MADTVLLATSREAMTAKLTLLHESATEMGMVMHPAKSCFLAINTEDKAPFHIGTVKIINCESYCYLGSQISNSSINRQVQNQLKSKQSHVYKYYSFIHKNSQAPYKVKEKVLQGAVCSAISYSCESWLTNDVKCL